MPSAFAVLLVAGIASPADAQEATLTTVAPATTPAVVEDETPRSAAYRTDRFHVAAPVPAPLAEEAPARPAQPPAQLGRDGALMVVGGALLVAGLLIGDDAGTAVAIAGAAIGAYGLYLYLQ